MSFSVSPSVTVREVDLTTSVPAITTPPAAIAGVFRWGPVNQRVLISSEVELANVFGTPTDFNAETFFTAADFLSYSNALYVVRVTSQDAESSVGVNSLSEEVFEGKYPGSIADDFEVSYIVTDSDGDTSSFELELPIDANTNIVTGANTISEGAYSINFNESILRLSTSETLDVKKGDSLILGSDDFGYQTVEVLSVDIDANTTPQTYEFELSQRYRIASAPEKITRVWRHSGNVNAAPGESSLHIVVIDTTGKLSGAAGSIIEKFENLSTIPGTKSLEGTNLYYKDVLEQRSSFIKPGSVSISDTTSVREYVSLEGGSDGDSENQISFGVVALGYDLFKEANDVDVSFILQGPARGPGVTKSSLSNYLISNIAENRRDVVVFVSPNKDAVVNVTAEQTKLTNIIAFRGDVQNSSYAFIDSGYKYRYDKYNDTFRWVPLNGDMAGLASLVEPWESPAGLRKGRVRNVIKLAFNPNKAQRDQLYGSDVNPVITQIGQGTILFGDKTALGTATGSAFTRINVRRLFIAVEKAIATISAQFLFEFNDEFTQNQFRQIVDPFLRDIQGRRGIIDFRVVSDATVNTPQVVDSNTFRANIFIKPARVVNFVELTFIATRSSVEFEEIVGQQF